jgi:ankyrin repeat protein
MQVKNKNVSVLNKRLFNAASAGENEVILELLFEGAEINSYQELNATPLFAASAYNRTESVKLLTYMGADIEALMNHSTTPLFKASYNCYSGIVKFLIDSGANYSTTIGVRTSFWDSVYSGCVQNVLVFLEAGADILSDKLYNSPLRLAGKFQDQGESYKEVYQILMDHYWGIVENYPPIVSTTTFEVVVVRYKEDLSWITKEFKTEKVIVYNKGEDDLEYLPDNCQVIKTPNIGWFGGTILHHLVKNYDSLAATTLFLQGEPYDTEAFLPLIRYKAPLNSTCNNIVAKCEKSTLLHYSKYFEGLTEEDWASSKYKCFDKPLGFNLIEFVHEYINKDYFPSDVLYVDLGAQFSVKSSQVHIHPKSFYERMLPLFNEKCPRADFYLEKVWDIIFRPKTISELNDELVEAVLKEDNQTIEELIFKGAEINSRHVLNASPIFIAAAYNKSKSVKKLSDMGADLESLTDYKETPLFKAAHRCYSSVTKTLLEGGANIETEVKGYTPLYAAASSGCVETVKILLDAGALTHSDHLIDSPILIATQERNKDLEHKQVYNIIMDYYNREVMDFYSNRDQDDSSRSFRVVVVRYDEDLLWLNKEFKYEKIVVYNKGKDNLKLENLPIHTVVINIPNVGWFGGTILAHLAHYYSYLDDRTLFLQGEPYEQHLFLPLIRYKNGLSSKCNNIIAKCVEVTLLKKSKDITDINEEDWAETKYGGKFKLFDNYTMIDFAHQYIDRDLVPKNPLFMVWGAQFAIDKERVYLHSQEYYERILPVFNKKYPMEDFYLEKLWNADFQEKNITSLDKKLYNAALEGDNQSIIEAVADGANINSRHLIDSTPFFAAGANNRLESMKLLSIIGADINLSVESGETPLHRAAQFCRVDVVKFLLEKGANKDAAKFNMHTPIYVAIYKGCVEVVRILLEYEVSIHINNTTETSLRLAESKKNNSPEHEEIFSLVKGYYWKEIETTLPKLNASLELNNSRSFQVVVVRYDEELSWLNKEFTNEEIIIYNKGENNLNTENLPVNSDIINIPNVGWFGGTILYHLVNYYNNFADRTLFLQGNPYAEPLITPLIQYKGEFSLNCINIIAKCSNYTLLTESDQFSKYRTKDTWAKTKYGSKFQLFDNYTMIDFAHEYVDENMPPEDSLAIVLGAQFAVDKENIYLHSKTFYQRMLPIFNETYAMADFYIEKLWDKIFSTKQVDFIESDNQLFSVELVGED